MFSAAFVQIDNNNSSRQMDSKSDLRKMEINWESVRGATSFPPLTVPLLTFPHSICKRQFPDCDISPTDLSPIKVSKIKQC